MLRALDALQSLLRLTQAVLVDGDDVDDNGDDDDNDDNNDTLVGGRVARMSDADDGFIDANNVADVDARAIRVALSNRRVAVALRKHFLAEIEKVG